MKYLFCIALFLSAFLTYAQDVVGVYELKIKAINADLSRTLTLHSNGTFEFYNYERHDNAIPSEKHIYGKGKWFQKDKIITFISEGLDLNDKYTLDFTDTKARFIYKSPRDKTNRVVKTALNFYQSNIPWVTGMKLLRINL